MDERDLRYIKFVFGRAQSATDEQLIKELDDPEIDSPQALYRQLNKDGYPVCPECGTAPVRGKHCEHSKQRRKARSGAGARTELPSAAKAVPLVKPVVDALNDYMLDLTTLRETYANERFEVVDRNDFCVTIDLVENTTTYDPMTIPLGARQDPPHQLTALITAYVIEGKSLDPLLEALHYSPTNVDREQLEKKADQLRLAARHTAKLLRGGRIRTGHHTEELSAREQAAVESITRRLRAGVPESEIDQNLTDRGFIPNDIRRLKEFRIDHPSP